MAYNNKHYQAVADAIKTQREVTNSAYAEGTAAHAFAMASLDQLAERMADTLAAHHKGAHPFSHTRFLKACGL